jgi:hypothetical protein
MTTEKKTYLLLISGIFLFAVAVRLVCFVGLIGSDDLNYNRSAYAIAQGTFTPQLDHQRTRLGLFVPVAGAFRLFGINELSSTLFPFVCFVVTFIVLIWMATTYFGRWVGIIAGLLYALLPVEIFNASILLPDLPAAAFIAVSGALFYWTETSSDRLRSTMVTLPTPYPSQDNAVELSKSPFALSLSKGFFADGSTSSPRTEGLKSTTLPSQEGNSVHPRKKFPSWEGQGVGLLSIGSFLLAGLLLGVAYMIRETALFLGIFLAGYMMYKAWTRKTVQWSWLWFWIGFFLVIGAELGYYYWTTGNPLYRYYTIESGHNLSVLALRDRVHGLSLLRRLTLDQLLVLFQVPDFGFSYFFIFAGIIYGIQKRVAYLRYFIGWFITFFLLFNFSSTSLVEYYPIRPIPRYFIVLTVPGIIIMSWYLREMATFLTANPGKGMGFFRVSLLFPFLLAFVINLFWFSIATTLLLVSITPIVLMAFSECLRTWFRIRLSPKYVAIVPPLIFLYLNILPGIYTAAKGERPRKGITCERDIRPLLEFPLTHTIYTDERTEAILEYFYAYQDDNQIKQFREADVTTWKHAYVIVNWERLLFLNRLYQIPIPEFASHPSPQWRLYTLLGDELNPCVIYEVP